MKTERQHIARLAKARYGCSKWPLLCVEYFLSDRRAAGLGVLAKLPKRPRGWPVLNRKDRDLMTGAVRWECEINRPERLEFPVMDDFPCLGDVPEYVTVTAKPAVRKRICLEIPAREFERQQDRDVAARKLRDLRRQLRVAAAPKGTP